jgi:hypothetical protein
MGLVLDCGENYPEEGKGSLNHPIAAAAYGSGWGRNEKNMDVRI